LDEIRQRAYDQNCRNQVKVKKAFDRSTRYRDFIVGDIVLLWDKGREKPGKYGKFDSLWLEPYLIREIAGPNSFHLIHLDGEPCYPQYLGITRRSCLEAHMVLDMEYREQE
jgi:hypothetical protein